MLYEFLIGRIWKFCVHIYLITYLYGICLLVIVIIGSGKTYTVFGPDAIDAPEAWFKHETPQPLWGIFPRLAYEIFQEKTDAWKVILYCILVHRIV